MMGLAAMRKYPELPEPKSSPYGVKQERCVGQCDPRLTCEASEKRGKALLTRQPNLFDYVPEDRVLKSHREMYPLHITATLGRS